MFSSGDLDVYSTGPLRPIQLSTQVSDTAEQIMKMYLIPFYIIK